ncbi:MAG: hypothetical protein QXK81_04475 [Candidatus Bathyarchaeia archaeon]
MFLPDSVNQTRLNESIDKSHGRLPRGRNHSKVKLLKGEGIFPIISLS